MRSLNSRIHIIALMMPMFFAISCAVIQKPGLPKPIATSTDQMPEDAAAVVTAIQQQMTQSGEAHVSNVRFQGETGTNLARTWSFLKGFTPKSNLLYIHQVNGGDSKGRTIFNQLNLEGPLGRRASVFYRTDYRASSDEQIIDMVRAAPIYAESPEPIMFVVPAKALPEDLDAYPEDYLSLLQLVGEHAVDSSKSGLASSEMRDYVIFVFLLDPISPSSLFEVKISDEESGMRGYKESTRYIDFNGWRVALLSGRFRAFDTEGTNPLYVKAVFTPGKEVSLLKRSQNLVGLFFLDGSQPQP